MKTNVRKLLNFLFIVGTLLLIFIIAFSNNELGNAWEALFTLRLEWVVASIAGWFGYMAFDAIGLWRILRHQGYRIPLPYALYVSLVGFYYSNITPGASGGQPMQIYYMKKRDIPVGIGSSAISLKFLCSQLMMVLFAAGLWLGNRGFIDQQLSGVRWIILIGFAINFAAVPLILLVAFCRPLVQNLGNFCIRVGAKLRLCKNPELSSMRLASTLDTFHSSILSISKHPWFVLEQLVWSGLSLLSLLSVTVSVFHAFDMPALRQAAGLAPISAGPLLAVAILLFLSVSYTPLPGASGAQEGGFLVFFRGLFIGGKIGLALLVWRFFTYYMFLIVGGVASIVANLRGAKPKTADNPAPELPASPGDDATEPSAKKQNAPIEGAPD